MKKILTKKNIIIIAILLLICLLIFLTCFKTGGQICRAIDFSRVESVEISKFAEDGNNGIYTVEKTTALNEDETKELQSLIKSSIYRIDRARSHYMYDMDNRYYIQGYNEDGLRVLLINCIDNRFDITVFNEDCSEITLSYTLKSSNKNWSKDIGKIFS